MKINIKNTLFLYIFNKDLALTVYIWQFELNEKYAQFLHRSTKSVSQKGPFSKKRDLT